MARKPLKRKAYVVGLIVDGAVVEHEIEVCPADQLRGETEGQKHGLPADMSTAPMHYGTLWVYLAMVRLGLYAGKFQQFTQVDLYEFEAIKDDDGAPAGTVVDPTEAEPGSASPSPATTEIPGSGSTPTSTNG